MFGRNREELDYNVYPTEEGKQILAEQALDRIEVIDGVEYLDGYKLPPDNDELWDPDRIISGTIRRVWIEDGQIMSTEKHTEHVLSLTNAFIRDERVRSLAVGKRPLFLTWEEVDLSGFRRNKPTNFEKVGNFITRLLGKAA